MSTTRDAQLNSLIRLKQVPAPPVERWQMAPFTRCSKTGAMADKKVSGSPSKTSGRSFNKTPERRLAIKCKTPHKTPTFGTQRTPGLGNLKTPTTTPGRTGQTPSSCRYVPNRATSDMEYSSFLLTQQKLKEPTAKEKDDNEERVNGEESGAVIESPPANQDDNQRLLEVLSRSRGQHQTGVLSFKSTTPKLSGSHSYLEDYMEGSGYNSRTKSAHNPIEQICQEKVLDAPTIKDDYYLNTLDWGKNNILAVGLDSGVYLWNARDGSTHQLMELKEGGEYVSSLSWSGNGKYLAIGDSMACVQLWDVEKEKKIRTMRGHSDRVGVLAWNKHTVSSASRDGLILHNDVRKAEPVVGRSQYHRMEVCGLQWSRDGSRLASGGNDNVACIWTMRNPSQPVQELKGHEAAIKAVAWCPWEPNTLVTGGGTNDRTIRFWNAFTGQCTKIVQAKSQVSSLAWNKHSKQLLSAHGQPRNYMVVWDYPSMTKASVLSGHTERILHMTVSPRRTRVASASSDETLRIWKCFRHLEHDVSQRSYSEESISALLQTTLELH